MKYQEFLLHVRKPLFFLDQREIVFYDSTTIPETFREFDYLLNRYAFTQFYHKYKQSAGCRKMSFELTKVEFGKLTSSKCFYCGNSPNYLFNAYHKGKLASKKPYIYNGIDRVDPKKGYIMPNCVPCCGICNRMKGLLDSDFFLERIKMIYYNKNILFENSQDTLLRGDRDKW